MPFEDDPEDERPIPDRLLPAEDRLWRHPSEIHASGGPPAAGLAGTSAVPPGRGDRRAPALTALAGACLAGAVVTFGVMWIVRPARVEVALPASSVRSSTSILTTFTKEAVPTERLAIQLAPTIATLRIQRAGVWTTASALWVDDNGTLATAAPIVAEATQLIVVGHDGTSQTAQLAGTDPATGVAALVVDRTAGTPIAVAGQPIRAGESCTVVGAGRTDAARATSNASVASVVIRSISLRASIGEHVIHDAIQLDRQIPVDASGGALVDVDGGLLGLVVGNSTDRNLGTAVNGNSVVSAAKELRENGLVKRAWLGVQAVDLTPDLASMLQVSGGARLTNVTPASPAASAGLRTGDVITAVANAPIANASDLVRTLRTHRPDEAIELTVTRGKSTTKVTATLGTV